LTVRATYCPRYRCRRSPCDCGRNQSGAVASPRSNAYAASRFCKASFSNTARLDGPASLLTPPEPWRPPHGAANSASRQRANNVTLQRTTRKLARECQQRAGHLTVDGHEGGRRRAALDRGEKGDVVVVGSDIARRSWSGWTLWVMRPHMKSKRSAAAISPQLSAFASSHQRALTLAQSI